jgi:hypothetical protein
MKINIISVNHKGHFIFNEADLSYINILNWHNKLFMCWYIDKYIVIKLVFGIYGGIGIVKKFVDFKVGEFITFTYNNKDYSEWESDMNHDLIKYKNIHSNEICVILGNGPSIKNYKKIKNAIHFGMNHIYNYIDYDIDYYFLNDIDGFIKNPDIANYKVNKMRFYSHYKKKSSFACGTGIYPKYKKELDNSNHPYQIVDCCTTRDISIKPFTWFRELDKFCLGSSRNTGLKVLELALYMGFKHIVLVGCDCTDKYSYLTNRWNHAFNEVNKLYNNDNINISIYNPVNLKLKPEFNLNNIFILEKIDNSSFYFNKYLMDCLFNHSIWDNTTLYDINNNKIVLKYHNDILGIGSYSRNIDDIRIIKLDNASLKRELNNIIFKKFNNDLILNDELQFFNNIQLFTNIKTYKRSKYINNKLLTINKNKEKHSHIIDITINNEYVLITNNSIELRFYISNCNEKKILLISHILKILKTKYSFTLC